MKSIHGGDIYTNKVKIDFSVNVNPLGIPKSVEDALHKAVYHCHEYPDINAIALKNALAKNLAIDKDYLLLGNGASEIFMAIAHTIKAKKILLPIPSFYGYQYVANAMESQIEYALLKEENGFLPGEDFFDKLKEDIDLIFLANPNNPTGLRLDKKYLIKILDICKEKNIFLVLDECFIPFCQKDQSLLSEIEKYKNLLIVGAFTKIYSIPGVRLGFLVTSNMDLNKKISSHLPEWNLSVFAQEAGLACTKESAFIEKTASYVKKEREFLSEKLEDMGITSYPGEGNFILIYSEKPLYDLLLERGILIRDCQNFKGLSNGYYRIAVKSREENKILLRELGECLE